MSTHEIGALVRHRCTLVVAVVVALTTAACGSDSSTFERIRGSGDAVVEQRRVGEFDHVELRGEGRVLLGAGQDGVVEVEIDDNLVAEISTDVRDGRLVISTRASVDIEPQVDVVYRLGCPATAGVRLSGAGSIALGGCVHGTELAAELPGAGSLRLGEVDLERLMVSISGAGDVSVAGSTRRLAVDLTGVGDLEAGDLRADEVVVSTSGAGSATVWAVDDLELSLTGVGSISYYGDPAVSPTVSGIGSVTPLGDR